jgi:hypothetical protein
MFHCRKIAAHVPREGGLAMPPPFLGVKGCWHPYASMTGH